MKNIVICCDGTFAKYGAPEENTNAVRLFERLGKDGAIQISYYDPGVGTYSPAQNPIKRWLQKAVMGISGAGVQTNVEEAYKYLMAHYEPQDRIFLFGYSRGAHTVRTLAGMLHKCGLLTKGSNNLVPYATKIYQQADDDTAKGFRDSFSRVCKPHFIGVWDTVASMGWLWWRDYFPNLKLNEDVSCGFQALSIDERRRHFQPALWDEKDKASSQVIEQVWFLGQHADVGGQGAVGPDAGGQDTGEQKSCRGISDIALQWMLTHAESQCLLLRDDWRNSLSPDPLATAKAPLWYARGPLAKPRSIPKNAKIHSSVFRRKDDPATDYQPTNQPESYSKVD